MNEPRIRLHDVAIDGEVDRDRVLAAIERAIGVAATGGTAPSARALKAGIGRSVPDAIEGGDR